MNVTPRSVEYQLRRALLDCRAFIQARLAGDARGQRP